MSKPHIYVGLSGGVDSSVTAALLKEQGYTVTGVYMKNWSQDLPGFSCPWKEDYQDAMRVAVQLGIDFKMYDFQTEYRQKVVDYMIEGYKAGITPNPDIMCNQEVKFKLFLETALSDGADGIATGHYARTANGQLLVGIDINKDQSYFLCRVTEDALKKTMFPLGDMKKTDVRVLAKKYGLATAEKKDSQGICFIGSVGIKEFLEQFVQTHSGDIIDVSSDQVVGQHEGALFYTIGQRRGLSVGGGLPYYVVGKDMATNQVFVTHDLANKKLWSERVNLSSVHWINAQPTEDTPYQVRLRHRAPLVACSLNTHNHEWVVNFSQSMRSVTPGQSAVIYDGDRVVGSGIVTTTQVA
ncbi:tRNA 2-thiouridine(34) synthase MnmA [soil metagenome]